MKKTLNWIMFTVLMAACTSIDKNETKGSPVPNEDTIETKETRAAGKPGYDFSSPAKTYELPLALREVSGLAMMKDGRIACVQDEIGAIFIYSLQHEEIEEKVPFMGKGDFEELALVNDDAYVLESVGNIYYLPSFMKGDRSQMEKLTTQLSKANNAEGMCYDKKNNRLLISCKGKGEEKEKNKKAIYAFDLKEKQLSSEPVIHLSLKHIREAIEKKKTKGLEKALESNNIDDVFTPSGIAIHPVTGELYILSTRNNLLAILDMSGTIKEVIHLKNDLFMQPEGITFTSNGDLYISNEGKKGKGNILMFKYEK